MRDATLVTTQSQLDAAVFRLQWPDAARASTPSSCASAPTTRSSAWCRSPPTADCCLIDPLAGLDLAAAVRAARGPLEAEDPARRATGPRGAAAGGRRRARRRSSTPRSPRRCSAFRRRSAMRNSSHDSSGTRSTRARRGPTGRAGRSRRNSSPMPPTTCITCSRCTPTLPPRSRPGAASAWLAEEAAALENPALYRTDPAEAWRRLKGLGRLAARRAGRGAGAGRVARTAGHRDRQAARLDPDRRGDLRDGHAWRRGPIAGSRAVRALPPAVVRKRGEELLAAGGVARGLGERGRNRGDRAARPSPRGDDAASRRCSRPCATRPRRSALSPEVLATRARCRSAGDRGPRRQSACCAAGAAR